MKAVENGYVLAEGVCNGDTTAAVDGGTGEMAGGEVCGVALLPASGDHVAEFAGGVGAEVRGDLAGGHAYHIGGEFGGGSPFHLNAAAAFQRAGEKNGCGDARTGSWLKREIGGF